MAHRLQDCDLAWLEEPVWPPEHHVSLARVRREGGVRVAAGENAAGYEGVTIQAMAGIDTALWDLRGKAAELNVSRLIDAVPVYASGGLWLSSSIDELQRKRRRSASSDVDLMLI